MSIEAGVGPASCSGKDVFRETAAVQAWGALVSKQPHESYGTLFFPQPMQACLRLHCLSSHKLDWNFQQVSAWIGSLCFCCLLSRIVETTSGNCGILVPWLPQDSDSSCSFFLFLLLFLFLFRLSSIASQTREVRAAEEGQEVLVGSADVVGNGSDVAVFQEAPAVVPTSILSKIPGANLQW